MIQFVKDLLHGEPVMFVGMLSTGLSAWSGALVALDMDVPLWLAIGTPIWIAVSGFYSRSRVRPSV
jgi:hypothetical protein